MISRRILLGMFAAVGLFVPSWLEMDITFHSVSLWLVSQMAEWDSWRPSRKPFELGEWLADPSPTQVNLNEADQAVVTENEPVIWADFEIIGAGDFAPVDRVTVGHGFSVDPRQTTHSTIAFEAISVENADAHGIVDELNRGAEGLEIREAHGVEHRDPVDSPVSRSE